MRSNAISIVRALRGMLRTPLEAFGFDWLSRTALHGLQDAIDNIKPTRGGFFLEAGAFDGVTQSNTYHLERFRDWQGILVEPVPALAARCRRNRTRSKVFECALVGPDHSGENIRLVASGLMSFVQGTHRTESEQDAHLKASIRAQGIRKIEVLTVRARSLTSILDEACAPEDFDLLSLDLEGMEAQALRGLDFSKYLPKHILIEARHSQDVRVALPTEYQLVAELSHHDRLYSLAQSAINI